jgi:hypothetical protein
MQMKPVHLGILLVTLCVCCATQNQATSTEQPSEQLVSQQRSAQAWEERVEDSPWTISSDYFRQKSDEGAFDLGEWLEEREKVEARQEQTEKRLAELEKKVEKQGAVSPTPTEVPPPQPPEETPRATAPREAAAEVSPGLRFKVAMVLLPEGLRPASETRAPLLEALRSQFATHPRILLVGPEDTGQILAQQGIDVGPDTLENIALALGIYPAARVVVFVEHAAVHRVAAGIEGRLAYTIADGFSGRPASAGTVTAAVAPDQGLHLFQKLAAQLEPVLEKKTARYQWLTRVALVDGDHIYLCAGEASGLKPGDTFAVYGPGREIIHPVAKVSLGFQRGPFKGTIKVVKLFGADAAEASLVAGEAEIEGNDLVSVPE